MKNPRIEEILNILQTAAVDGGFKLFVNNGEIVAEDLLSEAPLMFEICFKGKDLSDLSVFGAYSIDEGWAKHPREWEEHIADYRERGN
tara:strand:- start:389 stop:652 length:264 start_codon:yes stop_codon:yes gene_type:complete